MCTVKWSVEIEKTSLDRRNLSDLLTGIGFSLFAGQNGEELTSPAIDACNNAQDVWSEAKRLRDVFTGPAQIDVEFKFGAVVDYSTFPPSRAFIAEVASSHMVLQPGVARIEIAPPSDLTEEQLKQWHAERAEIEYQQKLESQRRRLEPAYLSSSAAKILELMSIKEPTGETLYKIYELAEGHPSNRATFQSALGISKDQFNRFKDVVHNPLVSGDWARHGYEDQPKTSNPMTKEEAKAFVEDIAQRWLALLRFTH